MTALFSQALKNSHLKWNPSLSGEKGKGIAACVSQLYGGRGTVCKGSGVSIFGFASRRRKRRQILCKIKLQIHYFKDDLIKMFHFWQSDVSIGTLNSIPTCSLKARYRIIKHVKIKQKSQEFHFKMKYENAACEEHRSGTLRQHWAFMMVFLQSKNQPIVKLLPSLLAAQLNTSTARPLPPSSNFQICHQLEIWDFIFLLHVHLAPQDHRQTHSDGISPFLGSGKSKPLSDHRLF